MPPSAARCASGSRRGPKTHWREFLAAWATRLKREAIEPIEVDVTSLAHDGRGVARHEGKTVFVAGALPGERVRCQRYRLHRQYDEARLVEVLQASADRVMPRCAAFGSCGGCVLQQLPAARQIAFKKQEQLAGELARIGRVEPARWLAPLAGPEWNYRRRAQLQAPATSNARGARWSASVSGPPRT